MKNCYTLLFGLLLASSHLFSQVNLNQNLVAHYPFEGNANDMSGFSFHGTAFGETYSTGVYGTPNSAIVFDGTPGSYVDAGTDNRSIVDTLSISCFVRTTFDGIGDIVSKYDPGNDRGYHLQISLGKIRLAGRDGSGTYRQTGFSNTLINDSLWHHVLGVVRGDTWILYVDCNLEGAESNPVSNPDISSNAQLGIGKDVFSDAKYLDCEVDEVRLYSRLLTVDERDSLCATAIYAEMPEIAPKEYAIDVYPNPANEQLAIAGPSTLENAVISIYDLQGKLMIESAQHASTPILDISTLDAGQYVIQVIENNSFATKRFTKL